MIKQKTEKQGDEVQKSFSIQSTPAQSRFSVCGFFCGT